MYQTPMPWLKSRVLRILIREKAYASVAPKDIAAELHEPWDDVKMALEELVADRKADKFLNGRFWAL